MRLGHWHSDQLRVAIKQSDESQYSHSIILFYKNYPNN